MPESCQPRCWGTSARTTLSSSGAKAATWKSYASAALAAWDMAAAPPTRAMCRAAAERSPEYENEGVPSRMWGSTGSCGGACVANASTRAPDALCHPSCSSRANLSKALPTESSRVSASMAKRSRLCTSTSIVWPPETRSVRKGNAGGCASVRSGVSACARIWCR